MDLDYYFVRAGFVKTLSYSSFELIGDCRMTGTHDSIIKFCLTAHEDCLPEFSHVACAIRSLDNTASRYAWLSCSFLCDTKVVSLIREAWSHFVIPACMIEE
jgi:hypothetical protein